MADSACIESVVSRQPSIFSYVRRNTTWFFLVWALWLSLEYFAFGPNSYVRLHNTADLALPQLLALRQNLHDSSFGNWQPQWGLGSDRASYPATYDITALFFLIIPGWLAYPALMVAQRWIAGLFTFKLLHEQCEVTELAAIWAAMWYAMFSQSTVNRGWTGFTIYDGFALPGIPLFLYLLGKMGNENRRDIAVASCAGVFWAVAAHVALSFFMFPLAAFWFLCVSPKRSKRFWFLFANCILAYVVVALPLNWPSLLLAPDSVRVKYRLNEVFGGPLNRVLGILNPFLDNLIPCCLITIGIILTKLKKSGFAAVFAGIVACTFAATFYGVFAGLSGSSVLQAFSGDRVGYCVFFLLGVATALAIDLLNQETITLKDIISSRSSSFYLGDVIAVFAIAAVGWQSVVIKTRTGREMLNGQNQKNYFANPVLGELRQLDSRTPLRVATVAVGESVLPLFPPGAAWTYGLETADSFLVLPSDRNRTYWERVLWPEVSRDQGLFTWVDRFGQQLNLFYPDATNVPVNLDDNYNVNLLSLANVGYIISPIPRLRCSHTPGAK